MKLMELAGVQQLGVGFTFNRPLEYALQSYSSLVMIRVYFILLI
jgi:hypothetical protein